MTKTKTKKQWWTVSALEAKEQRTMWLATNSRLVRPASPQWLIPVHDGVVVEKFSSVTEAVRATVEADRRYYDASRYYDYGYYNYDASSISVFRTEATESGEETFLEDVTDAQRELERLASTVLERYGDAVSDGNVVDAVLELLEVGHRATLEANKERDEERALAERRQERIIALLDERICTRERIGEIIDDLKEVLS